MFKGSGGLKMVPEVLSNINDVKKVGNKLIHEINHTVMLPSLIKFRTFRFWRSNVTLLDSRDLMSHF